MISCAGGDHWIIEDNTIEWANGGGLSIGRDANSGGSRQAGASHILRRNTIRCCGIEGIGGMGTSNALIEDNLIEWCGWADAERGWEAAGAKFHNARNLLFRRNVVRHLRHANAIWFDVGNVNCRITRNVLADVLSVSAAVHIEMTTEANQIDNNVIWNVRNAEAGTPGQRGCAGSGIFDNATDKLIVAHNLIGRCDNSGIFAITRPDRRGSGTGTGNTIANNIFAKCNTSAIVFLNANNQADGNVYVGMPATFQGYGEGDAKQYVDLEAWRAAHKWDMSSVVAEAEIEFDPETLQLTLSTRRSAGQAGMDDRSSRATMTAVPPGVGAAGHPAQPMLLWLWREGLPEPWPRHSREHATAPQRPPGGTAGSVDALAERLGSPPRRDRRSDRRRRARDVFGRPVPTPLAFSA